MNVGSAPLCFIWIALSVPLVAAERPRLHGSELALDLHASGTTSLQDHQTDNLTDHHGGVQDSGDHKSGDDGGLDDEEQEVHVQSSLLEDKEKLESGGGGPPVLGGPQDSLVNKLPMPHYVKTLAMGVKQVATPYANNLNNFFAPSQGGGFQQSSIFAYPGRSQTHVADLLAKQQDEQSTDWLHTSDPELALPYQMMQEGRRDPTAIERGKVFFADHPRGFLGISGGDDQEFLRRDAERQAEEHQRYQAARKDLAAISKTVSDKFEDQTPMSQRLLNAASLPLKYGAGIMRTKARDFYQTHALHAKWERDRQRTLEEAQRRVQNRETERMKSQAEEDAVARGQTAAMREVFLDPYDPEQQLRQTLGILGVIRPDSLTEKVVPDYEYAGKPLTVQEMKLLADRKVEQWKQSSKFPQETGKARRIEIDAMAAVIKEEADRLKQAADKLKQTQTFWDDVSAYLVKLAGGSVGSMAKHRAERLLLRNPSLMGKVVAVCFDLGGDLILKFNGKGGGQQYRFPGYHDFFATTTMKDKYARWQKYRNESQLVARMAETHSLGAYLMSGGGAQRRTGANATAPIERSNSSSSRLVKQLTRSLSQTLEQAEQDLSQDPSLDQQEDMRWLTADADADIKADVDFNHIEEAIRDFNVELMPDYGDPSPEVLAIFENFMDAQKQDNEWTLPLSQDNLIEDYFGLLADANHGDIQHHNPFVRMLAITLKVNLGSKKALEFLSHVQAPDAEALETAVVQAYSAQELDDARQSISRNVDSAKKFETATMFLRNMLGTRPDLTPQRSQTSPQLTPQVSQTGSVFNAELGPDPDWLREFKESQRDVE